MRVWRQGGGWGSKERGGKCTTVRSQ
jgi:hypothetical protein